MKKLILLSAGIFFVSAFFGQTLEEKEAELEQVRNKENELVQEVEQLKLQRIISEIKSVGYPISQKDLEVVEHSAMMIGFDHDHTQAAWVHHMLIPDVSFGNVTRTNDFREDTLLKRGNSAEEKDYFLKYEQPDGSYQYDGFGYDRGHLAPSADFRWSGQALSESYFYSNMTPQRPGFNRESWAEAEDVLRSVIDKEPGRYHVITGPVLHDSLSKIKRSVNQLSVPDLHYKIIADTRTESARGMAFLMPNKKCEYPLSYYVVSIDSVEKLTGLDFFNQLDPELEKKIESKADFSAWKTGKPEGDVAPLRLEDLPEGIINTVEAGFHTGEKMSVAGKVVSVKYIPSSQTTFLNLDQGFPDQIFTVSIWKRGRKNFSYKPEEHLKDKYIIVTGKIEPDRKQVPTINAKREKQIQLLNDYRDGVR